MRQTAIVQRAECDYEMTEEDQPSQEDFLMRDEEPREICDEFCANCKEKDLAIETLTMKLNDLTVEEKN